MATPLIPWEPCNIPEELQGELNRRKINRSFRFIEGAKGEWDKDDGEWNQYRGPMTPWVRFCSNGYGREDMQPPKPGFVFFGGKNFYSGYGFEKNTSGVQEGVIGYVPDGKGTTHTIINDLNTSDYPIHVPPPEIEKITVTIQKELFRRATVEWTCFSKKQLEYMTPYFLVPGITCVLEWGWNHFDPTSLIRLDLVDELKRLNNNPYPLYTKHILKSKGNYDVLFGKITHFEWSADGNKLKCKTEITSQDRIYAGLVVDSNATAQNPTDDKKDEDVRPLDNMKQFVEKSLGQFKSVKDTDPANIDGLQDFVTYLQDHHQKNWKEYIYAVFYGRDINDTKQDTVQFDNKKEDFDRKKNDDVWLSMGLVMEIINYFVSPARGYKGAEMFRVDIDDCVISGHPNLISSDGEVLLIPNAEAPKYFVGVPGRNSLESASDKEKDYDSVMNQTTNPDPVVKWMKKDEAEAKGMLADYRIQKICRPTQNAIKRDNLDELINKIRYDKAGSGQTFEFPFLNDASLVPNSKPYPRRYAGLLKNLYLNTKCFKKWVNDSSIKTYPQLIEKLLGEISIAAGNFWDFRIVSGTGRDGLLPDEPATMKIVDNRFMTTANRGTPYFFDYFDADSLLQGLSFKPTLSNAQAIRTIYAQTNNPDKKTTLTNGENELLDYHFRDRLFMDENKKNTRPIKTSTDNFDKTITELQQLSPMAGSYQMTMKNKNGVIVVRRLCLPASDILKLLLDDGDEERNPKYTGIMPGIQAQFTIQGIGGLRTFMMFLVRNLPEPYSHKNIVFRIVDVQESIDMSKWTTTVTAGVIPLREHIKKRLQINTKTS
jgi:hypothetical protein